MQASVIYTPLAYNTFILKVFFDGTDLRFEIGRNGEKYSLRSTSRMQLIEIVGLIQHKHNL